MHVVNYKFDGSFLVLKFEDGSTSYIIDQLAEPMVDDWKKEDNIIF